MSGTRKVATYTGPRRTLPIQSFCERLLDLDATFATTEELDFLLRWAEIAVVGYFPSNGTLTHETFAHVARQFATFVPIGSVLADAALAGDEEFGRALYSPILEQRPAFNPAEDAAVAMIIKTTHGAPAIQQAFHVFDGEWTVAGLMDWATRTSFPHVQPLTPSLFQNMYTNALTVQGAIVLLFVSVPSDDLEGAAAEELETLRRVGVRSHSSIHGPLFLLYTSLQRHEAFARRFGWGPNVSPPFYVSILCHEEQHVLTRAPPESLDQIRALIAAARAPPFPLPPDPPGPSGPGLTPDVPSHNGLVRVTEGTFNLLVMQDCHSLPVTTDHFPPLQPFQNCSGYHVVQREVLVLFHTPWCGYCQALLPTYRALAKLVNDLVGDALMVAEYDCQANQVPAIVDGTVEGFPEVLLFPFQRKASAFVYTGVERTLPELVTFALAHSQLPPTATDRLRAWLAAHPLGP